MGSIVIVAIPAEDDIVWKVSSEKVPHLTLMFLGEESEDRNVSRMAEFVEHALTINQHGPFYLNVDYRDKLGDDEADVLFFEGGWDTKWIKSLRGQLLQQNDIRAAYEAADKFPDWVPHLTLGYPETPAKELPKDYNKIYSVQFDKIAVWNGNYEGPEFRLKWPEQDEWGWEEGAAPLAMSTMQAGQAFVLEHYGVKGMRWGVRKDPQTGLTEGETKREGIQRFLDPQGHNLTTDVVKTGVGVLVPLVAPVTWPAQIRLIRGGARGVQKKRVERQEKKFVKNAMSPRNFVAIHNGAQEQINRGIESINKKYPDPNKSTDTRKKYDAEVLKTMQDGYRASANSLTNRTMSHHLDVEFVNDGQDFKIHARQGPPTPMPHRVKHAVDDDSENEEITVEITGKIKRNANGHIVGFEFDHLDSNSMAQTAELGAQFLEHYGVKGMRWGQRKAEFVTRQHQRQLTTEMARRVKRPAEDIRSVPTIGTTKRQKSSVGTAGGADHPPTEDAIKVAEQKQKYKKSGAAALSNKELADMQRRLNLENDVERLMSGSKSSGRRFVEGLLGRGSKDDRRGLESRAGQATQEFLIKKGAKKAARMGVKVATGV